MNPLLSITRYIASALVVLMMMALAPAKAQTVVNVSDTTTFKVAEVPGDTYQWELYSDPTVDFAINSGNCPTSEADFVGGNSGATVRIKWLKTGTYFFKITATNASGCTNNLKIGQVTVVESRPSATISPPAEICVGDSAILNINLKGTAPWDITLTDGTNTWTKTGIATTPFQWKISPKITTIYWVSKVTDSTNTNLIPSEQVELKVNQKPKSSKIYLFKP